MKYMMLIASNESQPDTTDSDARAVYERIAEWWNGHQEAGRIIEGYQLQPSSTATTVRVDERGGTTVTDGPFAEGKEMIGGYAILDVADLDEALSLAASWPSPDVLEVRPVVQGG